MKYIFVLFVLISCSNNNNLHLSNVELLDDIMKEHDDLMLEMKNIKNINQVYSEIWESKEIKDFQISKEESLRGKDKKFSNCLYLEFTNGNDAVFLIDDAKSIFNEAEIGAYQLISTLT